jgi:hypothetical protein
MNFSYTPVRKRYAHPGDEFVIETMVPVCTGATVTLMILNLVIYFIQHQ